MKHISNLQFIIKILFLILTTSSVLVKCSTNNNNWAVLISGSNGTMPLDPNNPTDETVGFLNYAHQANVFHAYNVLIEKGYNPAHIILLTYDDLKFNKLNPFQGQLFNFPDPSGPGMNVRMNTTVDYLNQDVTISNFLNLLTGDNENITITNKDKQKKTLDSTDKDNVFIYMIGHGNPGVFCFPGSDNWCIDESALNANDMIQAIQIMYQRKRYHKLVIYIESCYSGGMFIQLPTDINAYAVTSSSKVHMSRFWYCGVVKYNSTDFGSNKINQKSIGSCLSGQFSASWMQYCDLNDISKSTLGDQYNYINNRMSTYLNHSHPFPFGNLTMQTANLVSEFIGDVNGQFSQHWKDVVNQGNNLTVKDINNEVEGGGDNNIQQLSYTIPDLQINQLQNAYHKSSSKKYKVKLMNTLKSRNRDRVIFSQIAQQFLTEEEIISNDIMMISDEFYSQQVSMNNGPTCYSILLHDFVKYCGNLTPFRSQFLTVFLNICAKQQNNINALMSDILMSSVCGGDENLKINSSNTQTDVTNSFIEKKLSKIIQL